MTLDELETVEKISVAVPKVISAADIAPGNRTLLLGYNVERDTWHVYLYQHTIFTCYYSYKDSTPTIVAVDCNEDFVPDQRLYPAKCDFEFCCALKRLGIDLPFTNFNVNEAAHVLDNGYYGMTLSSLHKV